MTPGGLPRGIILVSLVFGAAALWADSGWYLLIPPPSEYNEGAAYLSGLQDLRQLMGVCDSASECEEARSGLLVAEQRVYAKASENYINALIEELHPLVLSSHRPMAETTNANVSAVVASRCISGDDPQ